MKNKILFVILILILVFALQTIWVKMVVVFLNALCACSDNFHWFFCSVVFAPAVEETLYRYVPLKIGSDLKISRIPVVIGSSIVFGLAHDNPYPANILIQGMLGLSFSAVYITTGKLRYSILCHSLWNLSCFLNFQ